MQGRIRLVVLCAVALVGNNAAADGIPANPLAYTGVMLGQNGVAITTPQLVTLTLWRSETSTATTDRLCNPPAETVNPDPQGRFTAVVQALCVDSVRTTPELWLEVRVGVEVLRPRTKLRAVPFAVESERTSRHVVVSDAGVKSTIGGLWCGDSAPTKGNFDVGGRRGVRAAKSICETRCASTSAHMCSADEAVRSFELGLSPPYGWVKGAYGGIFYPSGNPTGAQGLQLQDCSGWTEASRTLTTSVVYLFGGSVLDTTTKPGAAIVGFDYCDAMIPILCCD